MKLENVKFWNYGEYSSDNYGAHSLAFSFGGLTVYFSYKTPVAFSTLKTGQVVCENCWGSTTGKHLNWIDGGNKKRRVTADEFDRQFNELVEKFNPGTI